CPIRIQIGQERARIGIADHGPDRYIDLHILTRTASLVTPLAVLAARRCKSFAITKVEQRVLAGGRAQSNAATLAAVTPVWATGGHKFLATKADAAPAAASGFHLNLRLVDKHRWDGIAKCEEWKDRSESLPIAGSASKGCEA